MDYTERKNKIADVLTNFANEVIEKKRISIVFASLLYDREQLNKDLYNYNLSLFAPKKVARVKADNLSKPEFWLFFYSELTTPLLKLGQKLGYTIPEIQNDITAINNDFSDWLTTD